MATEFRLPDLGSGLKEAEIIEWRVAAGDTVSPEDVVCVVETEKAVIEIPAPHAGTIVSVHGAVGDAVEVGTVIAVLDGSEAGKADAGQATHEEPVSNATQSGSPTAGETVTGESEPGNAAAEEAASSGPGQRVRAMPSVRNLAEAQGVDLDTVPGTGRDGRVTRDDVLRQAAAGGPDDANSKFREFSRIRRTISERMTRSWREIPHVFARMEVDAAPLLAARKALAAEAGMKIPMEALLIQACLPVLKEFPDFNATVEEEGIYLHRHCHIGVAVDSETGLVVPVLKHAERLPLRACAETLLDLLPRAVKREATPDELTGATFTVNNIGALGTVMGTSIIPAGTTAILSMGRGVEKPVVREGAITIGQVMEVTLSFDHRAIDGALAQRFMARMAERLERPEFTAD